MPSEVASAQGWPVSQAVDTRQHECGLTDDDAQKNVEIKQEDPLCSVMRHSFVDVSTHDWTMKQATVRISRGRVVIREDLQTNIHVFHKLVATEDSLWNCQSEISKSDETRGDVVGGTNAPDLLGLLNCTDDGGSRWAETT